MNPGEKWLNSRGTPAEILAVDEVSSPDGEVVFEVVAYRYVGSDLVHIRPLSELTRWRQGRPLQVGGEIQHKRVLVGVRVGSAERKVVTYVSEYNVCFDVFDSDGKRIGEQSWTRSLFGDTYEAVPE